MTLQAARTFILLISSANIFIASSRAEEVLSTKILPARLVVGRRPGHKKPADQAASSKPSEVGKLFVEFGRARYMRAETSGAMSYVRPLTPAGSAARWLPAEYVVRIAESQSVRRSEQIDKTDSDLPALIGLQSAAVIDAWREVQTAINANNQLKQPLPDPYFARAEIWSLIGNHDGALRDYLKASQLALDAGQDLAIYRAYFLKLHEALENLDREPQSPLEGGDRDELAMLHYARGYHAFWRGDLAAAAREFDDAVQLNPRHPLYWFYRALANKRLGQERQAQHDALIGGSLERAGRYRVDHDVQRLQGDLRQWLQGYRLGGRSALVNERRLE